MANQITGYSTEICRSLVLSKLSYIHTGTLVVRERGHTTQKFGVKLPRFSGELEVLNDSFWPRLIFYGATGFAEAFIDGTVQCSRLTNLLELLIVNRDEMSDCSTFFSMAISLVSGLYRATNTLSVSLSNVASHYDISNGIFQSFLSPDMTYSCPIWSTEKQTIEENALLEQAQVRKLRRIISEARLKQTDHVLEIGTGWGSFAIEAVRQTGCFVTSLTLSREQKEEAEDRIAAAGFTKNIQVLLQDYRQAPAVEGGYDKIISIEMLEHVGRENHETYFACVSKLLNAKHGVAVFQTSTMPETRYDSYCKGTDFIRKHIFPGANVPSITQLLTSMHKGSGRKLILEKLENIGYHYEQALKIWRTNFVSNFSSRIRPELLKANPAMSDVELESFKRKWEYYFCYCEAGFRTKTLGVALFSVGREGNVNMIDDVLNQLPGQGS